MKAFCNLLLFHQMQTFVFSIKAEMSGKCYHGVFCTEKHFKGFYKEILNTKVLLKEFNLYFASVYIYFRRNILFFI